MVRANQLNANKLIGILGKWSFMEQSRLAPISCMAFDLMVLEISNTCLYSAIAKRNMDAVTQTNLKAQFFVHKVMISENGMSSMQNRDNRDK